MEINNVYDFYILIVENNIDHNLIGDISFEEEIITWEYDGLSQIGFDIEIHLIDVFNSDKELLYDIMCENKIENEFYFHEPEIDETMISSYISET